MIFATHVMAIMQRGRVAFCHYCFAFLEGPGLFLGGEEEDSWEIPFRSDGLVQVQMGIAMQDSVMFGSVVLPLD